MTGNIKWPPAELRRLENALDELAKAVRERPRERTDDEHVWLTHFLVVRACGYVEQAMYLCSIEHLEQKAGGTARSYSLSWLERSINPSIKNITDTLGRFDQGFADEFEAMLAADDHQLSRDLGALVTKRHAIAHGTNEGLGAQRTLALYEVAKSVADWMIRRFCPDPARASTFRR